ncbi:MAG TPA: phenylalanine 4-monooxygenase [Burkholderiales bacterium]|jgi:phenylalanine-4-hydroxylase|nr:phenylalanine 4-monooxygenase [Burkholderiales bacterium]
MKPELRGDYSRAGADYAVEQDWAGYSAAEHALYRRLFERQAKLVPRYACPEWIDAIARLESAAREIPRFDQVSRQLRAATGWEIVAVPGLIPDEAFFTHLANRRFPVTVWLRRPDEFDYIVEPDVFHDFFGHVPLLFDRVYADHLYEYGKGGLKAMRLDAVKMLARLYWFTIEFGLMRTAGGIRAYGAGLLSSGGELAHCIDDPRPRRLPFELERIMRTDYQIDRYQDSYFVIESFEQLMRETAPDFTPIYARIRKLPVLH